MNAIKFDKYDQGGAYHWRECDRRLANWKSYNPCLMARYQVVEDIVRSLPSAGRLLDVGCGDGYLLARLAPFVKGAIGVDSEEPAVDLANQLLSSFPHCRAQHNGCYDLPFGSREFDIVTSTDVIEHLEDANQHAAEIARVLKPGGVLILTTPKWRSDRKWDLRHVKEFTPEELGDLLRRYFCGVDITYFWPSWASRFYETRVGWRLLKLAGLAGWNPFLAKGARAPEKFGQLLAVARAAATGPA